MPNTILITGAAGFIGKSLCDYLLKDYRIIALDCSKQILADDRLLWAHVDFTDTSSIHQIFEEHRPNIIIHCAGIAHQRIDRVTSEEYLRINSLATESLALAGAKANANVHFIFFSSISVYGERNIGKAINEEDKCFPTSDYAFSKLDAEKRLENLFKERTLKKLDILRLSPVYDSEWSLNIEKRIFAPKKLIFVKFGSGEQRMSAVSRSNLVDFIEYRLRQEIKGEENINNYLFCNTFNVCDERDYSFNELIKAFQKSGNCPFRPVVRIPLIFVWTATRLMGFFFKSKRTWLHSCYDKLAYSLIFDNGKMLCTGFKPKHTLESILDNPERANL